MLPTVEHFEQASGLVTREPTAESVTAGNDLAEHAKAFEPYLDAGFEEIYVANMGPHYPPMIRAYGEHILPRLRRPPEPTRAGLPRRASRYERARHGLAAQVLDPVLLIRGPPDQLVQLRDVQAVVGLGQPAQGEPAQLLGLDGDTQRLQLDDVAQRGAADQRPVRLEPAQLLSPAHEPLAEPRARHAKDVEETEQCGAVLSDLRGQLPQLAACLGAGLLTGGALEQVETALGRRGVVPQVDGEQAPARWRGGAVSLIGHVHTRARLG